MRLRGIGEYIATEIENNIGVEARVTVLGHVQRGGAPSALDRLIGTAFGKVAVDLIAEEKYGVMVAWQNNAVTTIPLQNVFADSPLRIDPKGFWVETARSLGIYLGEELDCEDVSSANPTITGLKPSELEVITQLKGNVSSDVSDQNNS